MDDLLTPLKIIKANEEQTRKPLLDIVEESRPIREPKRRRISISSPDEVLQILKSQPGHDDVLDVIEYLHNSIGSSEFNIKRPSPQAAQVLNVLATTTIPDHWTNLQAATNNGVSGTQTVEQQSAKLLECLTSAAGIGALLTQIKTLLRGTGESEGKPSSQDSTTIKDLLLVLQRILETPQVIFLLWSDTISLIESKLQQQVIWRELISLIAGGKILSAASEAYQACKAMMDVGTDIWIADGSSYAEWLGREISSIIVKVKATELSATTQLFGRSLSLGYSGTVFEARSTKPALTLFRKTRRGDFVNTNDTR